jgi:hypothetical protein
VTRKTVAAEEKHLKRARSFPAADLFQRMFFHTPIESIMYIENNLVRKGFAGEAREWE